MPATDETIRIGDDLRIYLASQTDDATRALVKAWVVAWSQIEREFQLAAEELVHMAEDGRWPSRWQVLRASRAKKALEVAKFKLAELSQRAGVDVADRAGQVVDDTQGWEQRLLGSTLPTEAALEGAFDRVDQGAIDAIVRRSTERITKLMGKIPGEAYKALRDALIRGVALGENPNTVAARLVRQAEARWTAGLARALTIARTEMLDAYRKSAEAYHKANADVSTGWRWQCSLSTRTCPACLSMHGKTFSNEDPGPLGHQNCRCTRSPVTRSWRELGFNIEEPRDLFPDAREWFNRLPVGDQRALLGADRFAALQSGALRWENMAERVSTPGWRDSYVVRRLSQRQRKAA
jgi:SPP1 gp7 family putative phage head morphogenesis protein